MREIAQLEQDPPPGIAAWTDNNSIYQMKAQICGPVDSPYENGVFKISIVIPETYPFDPPQVTFGTRIYHPNIDDQGRVCLDTLNLPPKGSWTPTVTLSSLLTTISQLMAYPNADDGLVRAVTEVCRNDRAKFNATAREWTKKYAIDQSNDNKSNISKATSAETTDANNSISEQHVDQSNDSVQAQTGQQPVVGTTKQSDNADRSNSGDKEADKPSRIVPTVRARPVISDSEDSDDDDATTKRTKV